MLDKQSILCSEYVIDGARMDLTPKRMLENCIDPEVQPDEELQGRIVDEVPDISPVPYVWNPAKIDEYAETVAKMKNRGRFATEFPEAMTRGEIAGALIDKIWEAGHFKLDNLEISADWKWNPEPVGNMAAFYYSVEALASYTDSLGVRLRKYSYDNTTEDCSLGIRAEVSETVGEIPEIFDDEDIAIVGEGRALADKMVPNSSDWIIYIPFDSCDYRIGGSLLAQAVGYKGNRPAEVSDPDYFIDCYEVVRELVEDGVAVAGTTVGKGGLMGALKAMTAERGGMDVNVSDLVKANNDSDIIRILFSEVPGVLLQIKDTDYDYVDAELLLQDVLWYPLGHPDPEKKGISITRSESGVAGILQSLLAGQASEGED
ncbi:MAG: hypothetical protein K5984_04425 [Bacteroidales bacterium]|nr:hypothetical protein [Bacteroidales bacterium]